MAAMAIGIAAWTGGAQAATTNATYFEDFSKMGEHGDALPAEWVTYGIGEIPLVEWQDVFGNDGHGPYYRLMKINGTWGAFSNSSYIEDVESDEWLVTPKIHIDSDSEILMITAGAYGKGGSSALNEFSIFISDTGNAKDDFTKAPVAQSYIYGSSTTLATKRVPVLVKGYAGKDVYLAFVNRSKDSALLGLTELSLAPYHVSVSDKTPQVLPPDSETLISLTVDVNTPYEVDGVTFTLSTSTGVKSELKIDRPVSIIGKTFEVTFPDTIKVPEAGFDYTVTIDPRVEGAGVTVVNGNVSTPKCTYTPVAVIEEMTGTWCVWCPRGTAYLNYFVDKYNDEKGKAIGIAVHYNDPMEIEGKDYLTKLQINAGSSGFPNALFQRTVANDPGTPRIVEILMETPCYSKIDIDKVEFHPDVDKKIKVDFSVENAYDKASLDQKVAFVVLENDVEPSGEGEELDAWSQNNRYSGVTEAAIKQTYGDELWPYFKEFCEGTNPIPYSKITYQHVARGIFPDYSGIVLDGSCTAQQKVSFTASFNCPDNVDKTDNIAVVALLIDGKTNRIVTATEMKASEFNGMNGVAEVAADEISISNVDGMLYINSPEAMTVDVTGIDGVLRARYTSADGTLAVPASEFSGMMIVRVVAKNGTAVKKIIF